MMQRFLIGWTAILSLALVLPGSDATGQVGTKSDSVVKVTAKADKAAADGKQVILVTLEHDKGWHTYANPVGQDDFPGIPVVVTVTGKAKPEEVKVEYPPGKLVKDKLVGDYKVYEDKVTIKATVKRAKGDTGPLEVAVKIQACTDKKCLAPAVVKVNVP